MIPYRQMPADPARGSRRARLHGGLTNQSDARPAADASLEPAQRSLLAGCGDHVVGEPRERRPRCAGPASGAMAPWEGPGVDPGPPRPPKVMAKERSPAAASLAALLHVRAHEVFGVGLEHAVDLVEQVVELLLERLGLLGRRGFDLVGLGARSLGAAFFFCSRSGMFSYLPDARSRRAPTTPAARPARPASCTQQTTARHARGFP